MAQALLRAAARHNSRFALAARAPGSAPLFVLIADNDEQAQTLVAEFVGLETTFSGLALASPRAATPRTSASSIAARVSGSKIVDGHAPRRAAA